MKSDLPKEILRKWGPQHLAKGVELGLNELDKVIVGLPVQPSLLGNVACAALGALGGFMAPSEWDEFLLIWGGHHSTTLWDYLIPYLMPAPAARANLSYIPTTGSYVPTRPGLGTTIKYAPEQRVVGAPKFVPGVLRPKFQLGS